MPTPHNQASPEKLYTIQEAAVLLNIYAWKIRRAVKKGLIPGYTLLNSRRPSVSARSSLR
jgi:excisionase family DNA binding protein